MRDSGYGGSNFVFETKKESISPTSGEPSSKNEHAPIGDMLSKNSISQTEEKSTPSGEKSSDKVRKSKKITADMSEGERAKILSSTQL